MTSFAAKLSVTPTDGSDVKPAILTWEAPPKGADYYTVQYYGSDVLDDIASVDNLVGKQESLEFHYQSLVMKEAENKPEATEICAEVTAFKDKAVVGVTPTCQKLSKLKYILKRVDSFLHNFVLEAFVILSNKPGSVVTNLGPSAQIKYKR